MDTVDTVDRALTHRERAVLNALLAVDFDRNGAMRAQAAATRVIGQCQCGCPSVDFAQQPGVGLTVLVNAEVAGTNDTLFLCSIDGRLGGIDYVSNEDTMATELPPPVASPLRLTHPATRLGGLPQRTPPSRERKGQRQ